MSKSGTRKIGIRRQAWLGSILAVLVLGIFLGSAARGQKAPNGQRSDPPSTLAPVPVLVELFTSEGCSSCPSAEAELSRLVSEQPTPGVRYVPIAFHVDYWDGLGWADPFSSPAWTARQQDYARSRGGNVYTPEAIVQGGPDCVGSDDAALQSRAAAAVATRLAAHIEVASDVAPPGDSVHIRVHVGKLPLEANLRVAVTESGLSVAVPRGENGGKTLSHAPVVRAFRDLGVVSPNAADFDVTLPLRRTVKVSNLEVAAFVQVGTAGKVLGVGTSVVK